MTDPKKYNRLADPLNWIGFKAYDPKTRVGWMDKFAGFSATFLELDTLFFRPKKYQTPSYDWFWRLFMFPVAPLLDLFLNVVMPLNIALGMSGQTKLPPLSRFTRPSPDKIFESPDSARNQRLRSRDYIRPKLVHDDAPSIGQCDGQYLFIEGFTLRNNLVSLVLFFSLVMACLYAYADGSLVVFIDDLILGTVAFVILLITQWLPHRKGVLFDRQRQLVTFFRGSWRKPITVPFAETGFASHMSGTGNLTKGLTLVSRRQPRGKWLPLTMSLVTGGGRNSEIQSEVSTLYAFMDKDNLGALPVRMQHTIRQFRKHRLTLWRLCWMTPPPDAWADYQHPESLYQVALPEPNTPAWYEAKNPERRAEAIKKTKIDRYVELYFHEQEHTEPELINEVEAKWKEEARDNLFAKLAMCQDAIIDLKAIYESKESRVPDSLHQLIDFSVKHLSPPWHRKNLGEFRLVMKELESLKKNMLLDGRLLQQDYDFLDLKNYIPYKDKKWDQWFKEREQRIIENMNADKSPS